MTHRILIALFGAIFGMPLSAQEVSDSLAADAVVSATLMGSLDVPPYYSLDARPVRFATQDGSADDARRQTGDLVTWLQGMCDYTVYEGNHQGRWADADQLLFSIDGQSYRQNAYYLNGFRINNRTTSGSTLYPALFEHYSTGIDPSAAIVGFSGAMDYEQPDYVRVSGNFGGLGGVNPTTEPIIHLFHGTGSEDLYNGFGADSRQHIRGTGTVDATFSAKNSRHHLSAAYGNRQLPQYDHNGLLTADPLFGASNYRVQAFGEFRLPSSQKAHGEFPVTYGYLANISGKADGFSELYLNRGEMPRVDNYSASFYAERWRTFSRWTTGLTWGTTSVKHDDVGFAKNIIDQDGESLEPWMPDGRTHELSWSLTGNWLHSQRNWPRIGLQIDAYNSLIIERPTSHTWSNDVFLQHPGQAAPLPLYRYDWTSKAYAGALLENEAVGYIKHEWMCGKDRNRMVTVEGRLGMSVDGMLMSGGSKVTPCPVGRFEVSWYPAHWANIRAIVAHDRMKYDLETLRFMSDRYMNANVYSATDGSLFTQTGGAHHNYKDGLWQPSYLSLIIPITLHLGKGGRHEIALIQSYRKFYHTWMPQFAGGADANGYYVANALTNDVQEALHTSAPTFGVYYLRPGTRQYTIGYMPEGTLGSGFFTATPYYMSQQTRYTYRGRKVLFSFSWQSMQGVSYSGLGNGPGSNNVGVLSESMANPNSLTVIRQSSGDGSVGAYPAAGRTDQDRAYVLRIALSYTINKHFQIGGVGNWVDGQPFTYYRVFANDDGTPSDASTQYAIVPCCPRGINPTDGNFGARESAIFHIEVFGRANWTLRGHGMELLLQSYNVYDFGNVLGEFCFPQGVRPGRGHNMTLTIPRGIVASLKFEL